MTMNIGDFRGFGFLPPSIRLPPELRPIHGATDNHASPVLPVLPSTGSVGSITQVVHLATTHHVFPLVTPLT